MNPAGAVVIYIVGWWVIFLAVLPMNVEGRWEKPDDGVEGADPGAPADPRLKQKAWLATRIAFAFWLVTAAIILSGVFNFLD